MPEGVDDGKQIEISNTGPIKSFRFTVPKNGGVVELLGTSGVGKSHALNAVSAWAARRGDVPARDGTAAAEVEGIGEEFDGVTARFSRRSSFSGELEVEVLSGKFDVGDLIDPGLVDPKTADARRIKALVQLATGEEAAQPELFYSLLPGGKEEFDLEVSLRAQQENDVVMMAAQVKRDLEAAARREDELATKVTARYDGIRLVYANVDLDVFDDVEALEARHTEAVQAHARTELAKLHYERVTEAARTAQRSIDAAGAEEPVAELSEKLGQAVCEVARLQELRRSLESQLELVNVQLTNEQRTVTDTEHALARAQANAETIRLWQAAVTEATSVPVVTEDMVRQAKEAVLTLMTARNNAVIVRSAKAQLAEADEMRAKARELTARAERLREAARGTDDVLSKIVQTLNCPLTVSRGRLVTQTDRGQEHFSDLSDGERVQLVIPIAVAAVKRAGRSALLVIDQRHWQDLSPENRALVAELVDGTGVGIITARVTDDPTLRAEVLDGNPALDTD
jgi:RecA/RadA recombinase